MFSYTPYVLHIHAGRHGVPEDVAGHPGLVRAVHRDADLSGQRETSSGSRALRLGMVRVTMGVCSELGLGCEEAKINSHLADVSFCAHSSP